MDGFLEKAAGIAIIVFASEMALSLLPEGNMRKFCKFAVAVLLTTSIISALLTTGSFTWPDLNGQSAKGANTSNKSYEDIILDVYNSRWENKNN